VQQLSYIVKAPPERRLPLQELILVIPPPVPAKKGSKAAISQKHFQLLDKFIDGFSLMTYDYNVHNAPGPNAPLHWVKENLELLEPSR
jgi:chitinase domain-containing protein 1